MNTMPVRWTRWITVRIAVLILAVAGAVNGCVTNPATGETQFSLISRDQEIQMGAEADQQIVAQYGVYDDPALASYVNQLGQKIAAVSDDPGLTWTFRVLDSPVINAFSVPGGYVYVTRGLMAELQNEAQLAMVLGHECGHVTARHVAQQLTTAQLANLGLGIGTAIFPQIQPFEGALQSGLQLLFLKFSRDDERQADELGVKYALKAGYEASEGAKFFHSLVRLGQISSDGQLPEWASTHPDPAEREQNIPTIAAQDKQTISGPFGGTDPANYLPKVDNVVYGDNPREGFVQSGVFYQPDLQFQFNVPNGWAVANMPAVVQMADDATNPTAIEEVSATAGSNPSSIAQQFLSQSGASAVQSESGSTTVNGHAAYRLRSNLTITDQSGQPTGTLAILSYFVTLPTPQGSMVFIFHGYTDPSNYSRFATTFQAVPSSLATVTDATVLNVQPYRVDVFSAPSTAPFSSLVSPVSGLDLSVDRLAIMNQVETSTTVQAGTLLKRVTK